MQIEQILTTFHWLSLPNEERLLMRELFSIPKTGGSIMLGGVLTSDGHTQNDLRTVTVEKMQHFLDSKESDFNVLLGETFNKVHFMSEEKKEKIKREAEELLASERRASMQHLVVSIMDSIKKLPMDLQLDVKTELDLLFASYAPVVEESVDTPKTNAKRTKKAE